MPRTLIIPDIHNNTNFVDEIVGGNTFDHLVCLGDYFDSPGDGPEQARTTALWVKHRLAQKNVTLLFGNHDAAYCGQLAEIRCTDWSQEKGSVIREVLGPADWQQLKLHTWVDGWLLTHAGWNPTFSAGRNGALPEVIDQSIEEARQSLFAGRSHPLLLPGKVRGGNQESGGIIWQDLSEATPIDGLRQIVGHTPCLEVVTRTSGAGVIHFLDTRLGYAGMLEEGTFTAIETRRSWRQYLMRRGTSTD